MVQSNFHGFLQKFNSNKSEDKLIWVLKTKSKKPKTCGRRMNPSFCKSVGKLFWITACFFGLAYQSILVTIDYTKYQMTSEISLEVENEIHPLGLSFCFDTVRLRIAKKFPVGSPCHKNFQWFTSADKQFEACRNQMVYNFTLDQIIDDLTLDIVNTIEYMLIPTVVNNMMSLKPTNDSAVIRSFFDTFTAYDYKCLRYRFGKDSKFKLNLEILSELDPDFRNSLRIHGTLKDFHQANNTYFTLFLHDSHQYPRANDAFIVAQSIRDNNEGKMVNYRTMAIRYLESPYSHRCTWRYRGSGLESRNHCIQLCIKKKIAIKYPGVSAVSLVYNRSEARGLRRSKIFDGRFNQLVQYHDHCKKFCPFSCKTNNYQPFHYSSQSWIKGSYHFILRHDYPTTRIDFNPKLEFIEYIIYVTSISSLWFGFVIYDSMQACVQFLVKKYKQK